MASHASKLLFLATAVMACQFAFAPFASATCDEAYAKRLEKFKQSDTSKVSDGLQNASGGLEMAGTGLGVATLDACGAIALAGPAALGAGLALYGLDMLITKHTDSMWATWNHIWDSKKLLAVIEAEKDPNVSPLRKFYLAREREKLETNLKGFFHSIRKSDEVKNVRPNLTDAELAAIIVDLDRHDAFCFEDATDPAGQKDARRIVFEAIGAKNEADKMIQEKKADLIQNGKAGLAERVGQIPSEISQAKPAYSLNVPASFTCETAYSDYLKGGQLGTSAERVAARFGVSKLSKKQREWAESYDRSVSYAAWAISTAYKTLPYYSINRDDFKNSNLRWLSDEEGSSNLISIWMSDRMLRFNKEVRALHPNLSQGELVNLIVDLDRKGAFCRDPQNPEDMISMRATILEALGAKNEAAKVRAKAARDFEKLQINWPY